MTQCMSIGRSLYRIFDPRTPEGDEIRKKEGAILVKDFDEADHWNRKKYGIFWTVNKFKGPRKKENCQKILAWAVDLDTGSFDDQIANIRKTGIQPSAVIQSGNGYHVYFDAIDADIDNYKPIVTRMIEAMGGDKNAKDICRILRVPAYCHWKDPNKPKTVKMVSWSDQQYSEKEIRVFFPETEEKEKQLDQQISLRSELKFQKDSGLWERIWSLDCEEILSRISGTEATGYELISFSRVSSGNLNILVNAKGTSCWIDKNKRIGSSDNGGPTIWQWCNWYQRDQKKTYKILKKQLPEVFNGKF